MGLYDAAPMKTMLERRVARVAQVVADVSGPALANQRILDLGCWEGAFALELARRGAGEVVGIEGRKENLEKGVAIKAAERLDQVELIHDDVRSLSRERHGEFDVVLCLGLLYHLDAPEAFEFTRELAAVCRGYALVETQLGLTGNEQIAYDGASYAGRWYAEDTKQFAAALDNRRSFWPTKPSLLNLLADVGFTSVSEVMQPVLPDLMSYQDHTLLLAIKGTRSEQEERERWPERLPRKAHPAQGLRYRLRDRLDRARGAGLPPMFRR